MIESVRFVDNALEFQSRAGSDRIDAAEIQQVDLCQLADPIMQGDEEFHIIHFTDYFWLIGPFVAGGLKAIDDLLKARPTTRERTVTVNRLPWGFRKPGWLGLRLYSTPGFVKMPMSRLNELRISAEA